MRCRLLILSAAASLLPVPAFAAPTKAAIAAGHEAESRGAEIYAYDQAAWHSADRLRLDMEKRGWGLEKVRQEGLSGYIVEPVEDGRLLTSYYGIKGDKPFAVARYWTRGGEIEKGGFLTDREDAEMSPLAQLLVQRRQQAMQLPTEQKVFRCTKGNPNVVVLPPRSDGSIAVYIMSSPVERGVYPAGGHYLYLFGSNGKLLSSRAFSNGCVNIGSSDPSRRPESVVLSHVLDPQPTEIHVFLNYVMQMPLVIVTVGSHDVWGISKGKVTWLKAVSNEPN